MVYGWNTRKAGGGYVWTVTGFEYGKGTVILRTGTCATRAQAVGAAKRNVMVYRRAKAA
jgi:hypothetical protein